MLNDPLLNDVTDALNKEGLGNAALYLDNQSIQSKLDSINPLIEAIEEDNDINHIRDNMIRTFAKDLSKMVWEGTKLGEMLEEGVKNVIGSSIIIKGKIKARVQNRIEEYLRKPSVYSKILLAIKKIRRTSSTKVLQISDILSNEDIQEIIETSSIELHECLDGLKYISTSSDKKKKRKTGSLLLLSGKTDLTNLAGILQNDEKFKEIGKLMNVEDNLSILKTYAELYEISKKFSPDFVYKLNAILSNIYVLYDKALKGRIVGDYLNLSAQYHKVMEIIVLISHGRYDEATGWISEIEIDLEKIKEERERVFEKNIKINNIHDFEYDQLQEDGYNSGMKKNDFVRNLRQRIRKLVEDYDEAEKIVNQFMKSFYKNITAYAIKKSGIPQVSYKELDLVVRSTVEEIKQTLHEKSLEGINIFDKSMRDHIWSQITSFEAALLSDPIMSVREVNFGLENTYNYGRTLKEQAAKDSEYISDLSSNINFLQTIRANLYDEIEKITVKSSNSTIEEDDEQSERETVRRRQRLQSEH